MPSGAAGGQAHRQVSAEGSGLAGATEQEGENRGALTNVKDRKRLLWLRERGHLIEASPRGLEPWAWVEGKPSGTLSLFGHLHREARASEESRAPWIPRKTHTGAQGTGMQELIFRRVAELGMTPSSCPRPNWGFRIGAGLPDRAPGKLEGLHPASGAQGVPLGSLPPSTQVSLLCLAMGPHGPKLKYILCPQ